MAENIIDKARYGSPELKVSTPNNNHAINQ